MVTSVTLIWLISYYTISRWHTYAKLFTCMNTQSAIMRYLQTYYVAQRAYMCLEIYWDIILCGHSGLWPFWFVAVSVRGLLGSWPFRFVAVPVCGCFGCCRFGLWPLWPSTWYILCKAAIGLRELSAMKKKWFDFDVLAQSQSSDDHKQWYLSHMMHILSCLFH